MSPAIVAVLIARTTLLVGVGLVVSTLLRRESASLRHAILLASLAGALFLPVASFLSPQWQVSVPAIVPLRAGPAAPSMAAASASTAPTTPSNKIATRVTPARASHVVGPARGSPVLSFPDLLGLWAVGSILILVWFAIGHLRLRRVASSAWPLDTTAWLELLRDEQEHADVSKVVRLMSSPAASTPLTWGVLHPVILLPEDAAEWDIEHRRVVLRHELAHIARLDSLSQLLAGFTCALYWFNPVIWMAERKLRSECERACDDRVVSAGVPGAIYASHLLEVARSARSFGGPALLSVAMARPTQLEGRLLAVLDPSRRRNPPSRRARTAIIATAALFFIVLSAFQPVRRGATEAARQLVSAKPPVAVSPTSTAPTGMTLAATNSPAPVREQPIAELPPPTAIAANGIDSLFERTVPARSGGTLTLNLIPVGGEITIIGWDRDEVNVQAHLGGRSWRDSEVLIGAVGDGVEVRSRYNGSSHNTSFSNHFTIHVPRSYNVRLKSSGGGLSVSGVKGTFTGTTGGGELEFDRVEGELRLTTGGGEIHVRNSRVDGSVTTGGGEVRIVGNTGDLRASSGSGEVYIEPDDDRASRSSSRDRDSRTFEAGVTTFRPEDDPAAARHFGEGGTQIRRSGGDVTLPSAPNGARVTTGGGTVRIGASAGEVYASTGGGEIEIGPASGSVIAQTGAGEITVTFAGRGAHSADLTTGNGRIVVYVPTGTSATLELESAYTNNLGHRTTIDSDFPVAITETTDWDASVGTPRRYVRGRTVLGGGGGVIRVRSINGDVVVRRIGG